jgi:hypothetical protein
VPLPVPEPVVEPLLVPPLVVPPVPEPFLRFDFLVVDRSADPVPELLPDCPLAPDCPDCPDWPDDWPDEPLPAPEAWPHITGMVVATANARVSAVFFIKGLPHGLHGRPISGYGGFSRRGVRGRTSSRTDAPNSSFGET